MDVTPHELRTVEFKEAWRGYRQDDVDDLLDRVAVTLEGLFEQIQDLTDRVGKAEAASGEAVEQMLRRTLVLAQQTADETVTEAQQRAQQALLDAESEAQRLIDAAQTEADGIRRTERGRIEQEVEELVSLRDRIAAHVAELDSFEQEYRSRLRTLVETDLVHLTGRPPVEVPPRPVPPADLAPADLASAPSLEPTTPPAIEPAPTEPPRRPSPVARRVTSPRDLDDEEFFASLREAVHDTTPLGPRDDPAEFEPDDDPGSGGRFGALFRRRA